jgi:hypothetical protein
MMICSLLVFLQMFGSAKESIDHYNQARAVNKKALTICSQKRYVKFFEGFLNFKLMESASQEEKDRKYLNYFEQSLRRHNKLLFNLTFDDMRSESLDCLSVSLGPFPKKINFNFEVTTLFGKDLRLNFSFREWARQLEGDEDRDTELARFYKWLPVKVGGQDQFILFLNFAEVCQKVTADFRFEFFEETKSWFYMWLNVSGIMWNEALRHKDQSLLSPREYPLAFDYITEHPETEALRSSVRKDEISLSN